MPTEDNAVDKVHDSVIGEGYESGAESAAVADRTPHERTLDASHATVGEGSESETESTAIVMGTPRQRTLDTSHTPFILDTSAPLAIPEVTLSGRISPKRKNELLGVISKRRHLAAETLTRTSRNS